MPIDLNSVVFFAPFASLAASLAALIISVLMHRRVNRIFRSANAPDIERLLKLHTRTLEEFVQYKAESAAYMKSLDDRIKEKIRGTETVRFNPFKEGEVGSNQSFSTVLADEEGNGVVVTSMHTRDRTNVFAKPLKYWKSEYELTGEEKKVIENSMRKLADKLNGAEK